MSHDHPDPALLVAYLDGTLFHRDAEAVERHLDACNECTALLASMRQRRAEEQASKASRMRMMIAAAVVGVGLLGYGLWTLRPRPASEQQARITEPVASEPAPAPPVSTPAPAAPTASTPPRRESPPPNRETTAPKREVAPRREATRKPAVASPTPAPQARADARRSRQPAAPPPPRVMWRTREQMVESSTDGGMTWTTDHTADRPIRASVFVNENVAWVVGDSGLILRRTQNGWFGASAPAEGNVTAVNATSPSRATVTLEDGRMFTTANGGVTWSSAP